jgi:Adaptin C-terminal domain
VTDGHFFRSIIFLSLISLPSCVFCISLNGIVFWGMKTCKKRQFCEPERTESVFAIFLNYTGCGIMDKRSFENNIKPKISIIVKFSLIEIHFFLQAAVPKSFTLQMLSPSGTTLPSSGGQITQEMRISSSAQVSQVSDFSCRLQIFRVPSFPGHIKNANSYLLRQ